MTVRQQRLVRFLALLAFATLPAVTLLARPQAFVDPGLISSDSATFRTAKNLTGHDVIQRMIERNRTRDQQLLGYSVLRTYEVRAPDGRVSARDVIRVDYRAPGTFEFHKISEHGSWMIRRLVFDRLLQSEQETAAGLARLQAAISEENYLFSIIGEATLGSDHCYVLKAQPKRPDKYLFDGELWITAGDYAIAKMSGRPAKALSFWIDDANFVREYQRVDGFWLPIRDQTVVEGKVNEKRVLRVEHQHYVINAAHGNSAEEVRLLVSGRN